MPLVISICTICGGAVSALVETCSACSAVMDILALPRQSGELSCRVDADMRPVLTVRDYAVMERLARLRLSPDDPTTRATLEKLNQCHIVRSENVAGDIATLGSRIVFSTDDGWPEMRVLVLPAQHASAGWTLSVTAPKGIALLGLRVGSLITAIRRDGVTERLHLLAIVHQPEAVHARLP